MKNTVLILNGAGLADFSGYDKKAYGELTLEGIRGDCHRLCEELGLDLDFRQTDDQDELFRWIAKDSADFGGVIINPVGYSSSASESGELYRSALKMVAHLKRPVIEVRIANIYRHVSEFRQPLHEPEGNMGFICGFGRPGYLLAIKAIAKKLDQQIAT
jgi:3-dehydroquinate dehydratase-2